MALPQFWWFWWGYAGEWTPTGFKDRYRSYGATKETIREAQTIERNLRSRYLGHWFRMYWNGREWVPDTASQGEHFARNERWSAYRAA